MEEWKEYTIEDVLELLIDYRGKTPKKSETGIPTLSAKSVKMNHIDYSQCYYISKEEYDRFMIRGFPKKGDILLTTEAPLGMVARLDRNDIALGQRLITLRGKKDVLDNGYLLYYFQSPAGQYNLKSRETGTTVTGIKQSEFRKLRIPIPPLPTQQKIAAILSSLDDKIELNNKINTNLEQQAQALFKNWFVDFEPFGGKMPEGWKEKTLYEYADFINGTSFKEDEYGTEGLPIIKIAELKNGITEATQYFNGTKDPKYNVKNGDILFSWSGNPETSIDIFIWSLGNGILNQHTFNVKSNTNRKWFIYCLLKYFKPEFCHRASCKQTTGLGHVTANDLKQITFASGEKEETDFETLITPIMNQIFNNKIENQKLASIRDTLLPKLMNREIEI